MAALALYSNAFVWIDNQLLTQEGSLSVDKKSGLNPVHTTVNGFSGMTQGSSFCEVTVETSVPSAGFEFNPDSYMRLGQVVEVKVLMASNVTVFKGFIVDATYHHAVDAPSKLTMKFMTQYSDFEGL